MQKEIFLKSEGDEWFKRNEGVINSKAKDDEIVKYFTDFIPEMKNILEVGCSNGWRLNLLHNIFKCDCYGVEPSLKAIESGKLKYPEIKFFHSTADSMPFKSDFFENIILGFCLYLCDRDDLFKISCEIDRILMDYGNLIILDFLPPFPYKNVYQHFENVFSYKMDYSKLFTWNPFYNVVYEKVFNHSNEKENNPDEKIGLVVLKKYKKHSYPLMPFKK